MSVAPNADWQINAFVTSTLLHLPPLCLEAVAIEQGGCRDQRSGDGGIQSITSYRLSWEDEARDQSRTPGGDKSIRGREMEGGGGAASISLTSVTVLGEFHSQHHFTWRQWQHSNAGSLLLAQTNAAWRSRHSRSVRFISCTLWYLRICSRSFNRSEQHFHVEFNLGWTVIPDSVSPALMNHLDSADLWGAEELWQS